MRPVYILLLMVSFSRAFSQAPVQPGQSEKQYYLQKARTQNTISTVIGITGSATVFTGMIILVSSLDFSPGSNKPDHTATGEALMWIGGGLMVCAIPFYFMGKKYKKQAMSLSLNAMPSPVFYSKAAYRPIPTLSLTLPLGK